MAYLRGVIDFDNLKSEKSYDPVREYAQSKLANLIFAIELQRRIVANGDKTISVGAQPGANKTEWPGIWIRQLSTQLLNALAH